MKTKEYTMINAFSPPTKVLEYNILTIARQKLTLSREDLVAAFGTCQVQEAIWRLIEKGLIEWTEDYTSVRGTEELFKTILHYE